MKKLQVFQPVVFHLHNIMDNVMKKFQGAVRIPILFEIVLLSITHILIDLNDL